MANSYQNGAYNTHHKTIKNGRSDLKENYFTPTSVDEIKKMLANVRSHNKKIKMVAASTTSTLIQEQTSKTGTTVYLDLKNFNKILNIDTTNNLITVQGGTTLRTITTYLEKAGLMLNISISASLLNMTIAEAISTAAVFGSDMSCGFLSSYVQEVEILSTNNKQITCSANNNKKVLQAVCCGLGLCGIILQVTLQCKPLHNIEHLQIGCSLMKASTKIQACLEKTNSLQMTWFPHTDKAIVITTKGTKKKASFPVCNSWNSWNFYLDEVINYYLKNFLYWICMFLPFLLPFVHQIIFWLGYAWKRRYVTSSNFQLSTAGKEHQVVTGWAIPIGKASKALESLYQWCEYGIHFLHYPVSIQFVKKDSAYLSPACDGDVCCISLTATRPFNFYFPYERAFVAFADLMKSFDGRPIWGLAFPSINFTKDDLYCLFPYFDAWIAIRQQLDPDNIFVQNLENNTSVFQTTIIQQVKHN